VKLTSPELQTNGRAGTLDAAQRPAEPGTNEMRARCALEQQRGKAFSDQECQAAKGRFLAFSRLVDTWVKTRQRGI